MRSAFILCFVVAAACGPSVGGDDNGGDDDDGSGPDAGPWQPGPDGAPAEACDKMDILFVVDDSGSMDLEQASLGENFPLFAELLNAYLVADGSPLDYHVAITTTGRDVAYTEVIEFPIPGYPPQMIPMDESGDNGAFRNTCSMPRRWLERTDPGMAGTFACAADVGINGPSFEMPLYASELAFTARMADGTNNGFLREDALLAVVYLTDEDDCSRHDNNFTMNIDDPCTTEPPQAWVDFFDELKGDRGRWATAVIAGPTDCESEFGTAAAAPRLQQFVQLAGANAVFSSICEGNLAPALEAALDTFTAACDSFTPIP
jgi:hypothetical protein